VVQHLPSKCKAPNSNPSTAKKKKERKKMEVLFKDLFLNFGNTREKKSNYFDGE
jgi:hypothetical protein